MAPDDSVAEPLTSDVGVVVNVEVNELVEESGGTPVRTSASFLWEERR
jgi:hypothetical protein